MSQIKTLNGVQYTLPQYSDTGWGANTGNVLTQYLAAIADVTLQLSGGSFTLTAETDFGSNFGLKALYIKSETANPASAGVLRLAKTDTIKWRNNANGGDLSLTIDGSDNLTYTGQKVYIAGGTAGIVNADIASGAAIAYSKLALTGSIVNADVSASAAIAYSKLTLTGSIVNADINASAAIAYSKLSLTGSVVNADIGASAAIAMSKLAALTVGKALQSNASTGLIEASSVTTTELGYLSGVTSAIQTQLNATISNPMTANLVFSPTTKGVKGTTTNDNTTAGNCGEYVSSAAVADSNCPSTNTFDDLTSISLTAGDWDVSGMIYFSQEAATWTGCSVAITTTSGNSTTGMNQGDNQNVMSWGSSSSTPVVVCPNVPVTRLSLASTTTVYLKRRATYSAGQPITRGYRISARRVR